MTKTPVIVIVLILLQSVLVGDIVINELLYDPAGTDTGNEWLELYNNGSTDVNLAGAGIQVGGSVFTTVFTFPNYVLRAGRFVLIGETNVTQAIFKTPLVMQNGGSETDGVRYISPDGSYTDTVLYDSPNSNNLPDDTGSIGSSSAPDVSAGFSLARVTDGRDTNNSEADFIAEANPTPGYPNRFPIDYALTDTYVTLTDEFCTLNTLIHNNSPADCDTLSITLKVLLNNLPLQSFTIQPINAGGNFFFSEQLGISAPITGTLTVELVVFQDVNPADNVWSWQFGTPAQLSAYINEILYNPDSGSQEWIELRITSYVPGNVTIYDAAGNTFTMALPFLCPEYLVLCRDQALLVERYPACPPANIMQVSSLPVMNNDGDFLVLKGADGAVLDSMYYEGNAAKRDISLERHVSPDSVVSWHYSFDLAQGTPGRVNSMPPPPPNLAPGTVKVFSSPFNPLAGEQMKLQYSFRDASNTLSCTVYDLNGKKRHTIAAGMSVGNAGEIFWNGRDKTGKPLPRGKYILLVEARNSGGSNFMKKQLTVVLATK